MSSISSISDSLVLSVLKRTNAVKDALVKVSAGKRINSGADDPAGLAIVSSLESQAAVYDKATNNIGDGQSISSIQDAALSSLSGISDRLQELAAQSSNGTLSDVQRGALNEEFQQLSQGASRIVSTTSFNGVNVFSSATTLQVGGDGSSNSQISLEGASGIQQNIQSLASLSVGTQDNARLALDGVGAIAASLSNYRGTTGGVVSRLYTAQAQSVSSSLVNKQAASLIRDSDIAEASSKLIASKIGQSSAVALYAQATSIAASKIRSIIV